MKKTAALLAIMILVFSAAAFAVEVGTTTVSGPTLSVKVFGKERFEAETYVWDCLSHTDGTLSAGESAAIHGKIIQVVIVPDSGDTAPTDAFDVTMPMTSPAYADILHGVGANVAASGGAMRSPLTTDGVPPILTGQSVTVSATNCGSANGFTVYLTVLP